jgi:nitroimidazol reductase NimA-like FMN-containing flavoprotein (pyridoxamine 5'-phosphate oxidase superfamily)
MADTWLEPLSPDRCLDLLRAHDVGRIAVIAQGEPIILPVNYRVAEPPTGPLLAIRTRPGNVIDTAPENVAFEIDSIDHVQHRGWSVLVRGVLVHAFPSATSVREHLDSQPWIAADRDAWLFIDPFAITGRELHAAESEWVFRYGEYL